MKYPRGWVKDTPDFRDIKFQTKYMALPPVIDMRASMPPVYDQGQLGSCTANAIASAIQFEQMKQGIPAFMPSRLFIYYNERAIEHTTKSDSGAQIRDGIKSVNKQGVCPETEWTYNISKFAKKPPKICYADALKDKVIQYASISQDLILLKSCLALLFPIVFGISVFDSFESDEVAKTGIVPMPQKSESSLGGHCIKSVGYDDSKEYFIVKNSWGTSWGDKGYCYIPYEYVLNQGLASDFWKITLIGN